MPRTAFATTLDYDSKPEGSGLRAATPGAVVARAGPSAPGPAPVLKEAFCEAHEGVPAEVMFRNCAGRPVYACIRCFGWRVKNHAKCPQCWTPRQRESFQEKYGGGA